MVRSSALAIVRHAFEPPRRLREDPYPSARPHAKRLEQPHYRAVLAHDEYDAVACAATLVH